MIRPLVLYPLLVAWAGVAIGAPPSPQSSVRRPVVAFSLDDAAPSTREKATAGIVALGGRVLHAFDDLLVVDLPAENELRAFRLPGIKDMHLNGAAISPHRQGQGASYSRAAWNAICRPQPSADRGDGVPGAIEDDGLEAPFVSLDAVRAVGRGRAVATTSAFSPSSLETSEFLAGAVSVNIVLVESDGSIDASTEAWSQSRENEVVSAIASGLEWIRIQEPQAALRFVYHVFPGRTDGRARTGYEPIRRPADPSGPSGEDRWVKDVLTKLGYVSGDRFARSRAWASDTRGTDGTDWAVNVFVVDSLADTDGRFADGRFAYSFIGGPHLVMTYDNQAWGIARMDMVLRHELLHSFYAFDEYAGSTCDCTAHRGYLDGPNANCAACNPSASACVMISNGDAMCEATRRHLGWADLDGDGQIDVTGRDPDTLLDPVIGDVCAGTAITGQASVVAAANRNPYPGTTHSDISVNRIESVEIRVDGSPWMAAQAEGGSWGTASAGFSSALPVLSPGPHRLEARAVDDFGNRDPSPIVADVVVREAAAGLGNSVRVQRDGGFGLTWGDAGGAALYRIYRRGSPSGQEGLVTQTPLTSWSDPAAPSGYYEVRPVDACGAERSD